MKLIASTFAIACMCALAGQASAQTFTAAGGRLTGYEPHAGVAPNFAQAKARPLPMARTAPPSLREAILKPVNTRMVFGSPGSTAGADGSGELSPVRLFTPHSTNDQSPQSGTDIVPYEYGTSNQVFTSSRVNAKGDYTAKYYPYRAAGKLFFNENGGSYVCSASLIQKGIVVTAAHCVAKYGAKQFYSGWRFVPAYQNGQAPYGTWTAARIWVKTAYLNGTDNCYQTGVVCPDDVAIIVLKPNSSNKYAGDYTGYFGVGWNGFGFNGSNLALINQLGYPVALDSGSLMERNDSQGFVSSTMSNNTIIGSLLTGGSSGGPWLVNLGMAPAFGCDSGGCTRAGSEGRHNTVVGVTSWGYNPTNGYYVNMQQGASPFTANNICSLINSACFDATKGNPAACNIKAKLNC